LDACLIPTVKILTKVVCSWRWPEGFYGEEFFKPFTAFLFINGVPIVTPTCTEAQHSIEVENGTLNGGCQPSFS